MRIISIFLVLVFFCISSSYGQFDFGLRGGVNYGGGVKFSDFSSAAKFEKTTQNNIGFHVGVYSKIKFQLLYIMPELVYTQLSSNMSRDNVSSEYTVKKLDLPISAGIRIFGPLSVFVGPSFQYILDKNFSNVDLKNLQEDISVGYNVGLGVQIADIGVNLRYEGAFSQNDVQTFDKTTGVNIGNIDTRTSQFILALTYRIH